ANAIGIHARDVARVEPLLGGAQRLSRDLDEFPLDARALLRGDEVEIRLAQRKPLDAPGFGEIGARRGHQGIRLALAQLPRALTPAPAHPPLAPPRHPPPAPRRARAVLAAGRPPADALLRIHASDFRGERRVRALARDDAIGLRRGERVGGRAHVAIALLEA